MKWKNIPLRAEEVETEITQRDHFNNDDVDLSDTIVREAIQNSLDAANEPVVEVHFRFIDKSKGLDVSYLQDLLDGQLEHARAANLDIDTIDFESPDALIIEDFGTSGLTGATNKREESHFSDFWRSHGKSHKHGAKRGRWGLGKLVYSTSSRVGAFWGVTKRGEDNDFYLMGQSVLNTRHLEGKYYKPHSYFADYENENDENLRISVPIKDEKIKNKFCQVFSIDRSKNPGLSIVIPFPDKDFKKNRMIDVVISNYFYPIISGKLRVNLDGVIISSDSIRYLASKYSVDFFKQIDLLFDFIETASNVKDEDLVLLDFDEFDDGILKKENFDEDELENLRTKYRNGETVGIRVNASFRKKTGDKKSSFIKLLISKPDSIERGIDLYVRGGLTLPQEEKFKSRKALGVMIAEDEPICELLGDAENAAHTRWTQKTEKLSKNYKAPNRIVRLAQLSLTWLHDILAEVINERDENALLDFFYFRTQKPVKSKKKKNKSPMQVNVPDIPKREKKIHIDKYQDGFSIKNGAGFDESFLPYFQRIRVAYDTSKGDAFKKYEESKIKDFSVGAGGDIEVLEQENIEIVKAEENLWELMINELPFRFSVTGFDSNRDLKISLPDGKKNAEND
ncbi:hypothetical protein KIH87_04540 [Paraneptunicella aestuarii]|uniref:hypothetical protein n=1 Tax=Paraneptunicella aestuarii TaxID=2831148 RepID=UPI001E5BECCA|nr:hypothetical protein [Paraneptunicella aestuarii]UAA39630.1 hypothetical protein KIH87_04540 [Paraneptunicella aestuarii]